jgi:hypothetical protein
MMEFGAIIYPNGYFRDTAFGLSMGQQKYRLRGLEFVLGLR